MVSSAPVLPGSHEFTYTYIAPMRRSGVKIRLAIFYDTKRFDVLVGGKLTLRAQGALHANGTVKLGSRTYHRFTATDLHAGQHVVGRLGVEKPSRAPEVALLVLAVLIALTLIVLPLVRRRRRRTPEPIADEAPRKQPEWT